MASEQGSLRTNTYDGHPPTSPELFSYQVNLEKRIRADHPLRRVAQTVDFSFVRAEVAHCYGDNGNESVDPVILLKMMFLLFYDDIPSERELMGIIGERLDYLWFLGYGLDQEIPNHSVLSKARKRWGQEVFERLFVRTVEQCVSAGLVSGDKLHVDASLVAANASKDSVIKSSPELIAAYKAAYAVAESKLEEPPRNHPNYEAVNDRMVSSTDPDAGLVRKGSGSSRPAYHHHRAVDDAHGVITAVQTTSGAVPENHKLMDLIAQHQENTDSAVRKIIGDHKYGTADNFITCHEQGIVTHLGDAKAKQATAGKGQFKEQDFSYDAHDDCYRCPAGQILRRRRYVKKQRAWEYAAARGVCAQLSLTLRLHPFSGRTSGEPTRSDTRYWWSADGSPTARRPWRDRQRRQHLIEGSFADATNNHGFKRARWRRLWRQQIQDYLIAAIQNVRILLARTRWRPAASLLQAPLRCGASWWRLIAGRYLVPAVPVDHFPKA